MVRDYRRLLRPVGQALCLLCVPVAVPVAAQQLPSFGPSLPQWPTNGPRLHVTLSRPIYRILPDPKTGAPRMPADVVASAEVYNWPAATPRPTAFTWKVYLTWQMDGLTTRHRIQDRVYTQGSPFAIDLKEDVRGGTLTVVAKTLLEGKEVTGLAQARIVGVNPSHKAVLAAFPPSRFGMIASKIGMVESGLRQFTPEQVDGSGGQPQVSRTRDVGLMQLNVPTGALTSADQVWDWRANVRRGLEMLAGKSHTSILVSRHASGTGWEMSYDESVTAVMNLNLARLFLGLPPLTPPAIPPLSEAAGSGVLPDEVDVDKLALNQLERDAIRRYNGGREYAYLIQPDPDTLTFQAVGWQIDPTRGGIRPTSGDPQYVRRVLAAHSGFVWPLPKPKPAPKAQPGRKRHRARKIAA